MEELKYFFSYVRMDSEFVLKLAKELRAVGANVWLDQLDILGGQHWDSTVEKALKSSKGMIAVLSPESVASKNVMDEVSYALDEGKLVVPVLIRSCDIPYRLRRVQHIDFTADYDTGFSQLLRALGIEQPVQPVESAAAQEPSLPERPESAVGEEKEAEVRSKRQKTKVLAAICIVALIAIISTVFFLNYFKTYSLTATGVNGSVTATVVDGSSTKDPNQVRYDDGKTVTLEAVPNEEYRFTNWSGDLSGSTNPTTLDMNADKSVTANFVKTYSLTATGVNGSVTATVVDGSSMKDPNQVRYDDGKTVTLEAVPNPGYSFTKWSGDLSDSNSTATLKMDADKSVKANFVLKTYSLTVDADGGSITKYPNKASYNHGEMVTLEAVPNTESGYSFMNWSGDLFGNTNPATLVMDSDKSVTANFVLKTYSLTVDADGGSVTKYPDKDDYNHGERVTLEAVPNPGYSFTKWSGDLSGSTNPDKLVMEADKSVTADFVLNSVVTPPGFYRHRGCVEFRDQEEVINRGPITLVRVCHSDYIYGLQLHYGSQAGSFFGLKTGEYGLQVTEWSVPPGERIVRVEGEIAKYGSDFLYVSRLRFITDKEKRWQWFDGKQGTPFEAADENGLPLRTISGWFNPRQHPSLKRAITSMTFHFGS
jgi:hypothetical protein